MADKPLYHTCGATVHVDSYWNGLSHIPVFYDAVGREVYHCPRCGEWLAMNVLSERPPERADNDITPRLLEAAEMALFPLENYLRYLKQTEGEEEGYCLACKPDERCFNHAMQREVKSALDFARAAIEAARGKA